MIDTILKEWAAANDHDPAALVAAYERFVDATGFKARVFTASPLVPERREVLDPHQIEMSNWMGISSRCVDIQPGVTGIWGANNTGKSRLLRAVVYALRGYAAVGAPDNKSLVSVGERKMSVELRCTKVRVRRGATVRKITRGAHTGEEEVKEEVLVEAEGDQSDKPREAQGILENWLQVDVDFLLRSVFIRQGELADILDEEPARRREVVYKMLGLDSCDDAAKRVRAWVSELEQEHGQKRARSDEARRQLEDVKRRRSMIPNAQLKSKLEAMGAAPANDRPARIRELEAKVRAHAAEAKAALDSVKQKQQLEDQLNELKKDPVLALHFDDISGKVATAELATNRSRESVAQLRAALELVKGRGLALKTMPAVCTTCEALGKRCELTPEMKDARRQELLAQYSATEAELKLAQSDLDRYWHELAELQLKEKEIARGVEVRAHLQKQIEMLQGLLDKAPKASLEGHALTSRFKEEAEKALAKVMAEEETKDERPELRRLIAEAEAYDKQIDDLEKRMKDVGCSLELSNERVLAAAFAKDGIPLAMARKHIGAINDLAAELTQDADAFKYRFSADLEVEIQTPDGAVLSPRLVAGSARQRGALVLVASLCRYMQQMYNLSVGVIWIDEIPFQDEVNTDAVACLVMRLRRWYPKVVFAACQWEPFSGKFDHEISLAPGRPVPPMAETPLATPPVKLYDDPPPPPSDEGPIDEDLPF